MSLKVDQFHRDNGSLQKNLLTTGVKDEQQNHRLTVVGIAVCLCANATAAGGCSIRTVPACRFGPCTSTGPAIGGRVGANGPYRKYPEGKLPRPAEVGARGSRRGIDVLYRLSGVPAPGHNHQCGRDPQYPGASPHLLPREP